MRVQIATKVIHILHIKRSARKAVKVQDLFMPLQVLLSAKLPTSSKDLAAFTQRLGISHHFSLKCLPSEYRRTCYTCPVGFLPILACKCDNTRETSKSSESTSGRRRLHLSHTSANPLSVCLTLITCWSLTDVNGIQACAYMLAWIRASAGN